MEGVESIGGGWPSFSGGVRREVEEWGRGEGAERVKGGKNEGEICPFKKN